MECPKTRYRSRRGAIKGAIAVARRNGDRRMVPFLCPACHGWHLTSKNARTI